MIDGGRTGIWLNPHHVPDPAEVPAAAAELEALGYGTLWIGGSPSHDLGVPAAALDATRTLTVATGVATIWDGPADALAARYHELAGRHPDRFVLGLGASHAALAPAYAKPFSAMVAFLDELDAAGVPASARVLAALGPKMLALSATRAAGSHPYLVTPEHTRQAREILGSGPLLAPEQKVVLSTDPDEARAVGRRRLAGYLALPNYVHSLDRLGFGADDLADGGSDRLVDALVAWGDADAIAARVAEHRAAGADHVALQVLTADNHLPLAEWRALAPAVR